MKNLERVLYEVANLRRQELLPYVYAFTNGKVQTGPFKDLRIAPVYMWGDGDTAAKLLGVYEDELHEFLENAVASDPELVINVGCAEGYYATGLAKRLPNAEVIAVDIEKAAAGILSQNMLANKIPNISIITAQVDHAWLNDRLDGRRALLVMDCEGAEQHLLDPDSVPGLKGAEIIVESHDTVWPGMTKELAKRFDSTHTVMMVRSKTKDPYQFDFLESLSDCDKWTLVHEGRPRSMYWLYLVPKK